MPRGIDTSRNPARRPGWAPRPSGMTIDNDPVTHERFEEYGDSIGTTASGYVIGRGNRYGAYAEIESRDTRFPAVSGEGPRTYRTPYRAMVVADHLLRTIDK